MTTAVGERLAAVLALDPAADAVEFEGAWHPWGELAATANALGERLRELGVEPGDPIALVLRNHPALVGGLVGALQSEVCVVTVNPNQGDAALADDVAGLRPPVVVACDADWDRPSLRAAVDEVGGRGILVGGDEGAVHLDERAAEIDRPTAARPGIAVEMLTSGTTGPPKRVPLSYADFARTIGAAQRHYSSARGPEAGPRLRSGVAIVNAPLVHMSGLFRTLLNLCDGRPIALLERFEVDQWLDVVRRHRPKAVSLVPAALRMVLDAGVDPADLASVRVVTSGTSPLPVEVQRAFEDRYDVAVLPSYGATEFAGGVAGWTLALHEEWADAKRGSVGRPQPGREVRIVDVDGAAVAPGASGTIEVRSGGGDWVRTTDLGRLDADGFLWIEGRSDDAILRGGFKVFPGEIVDALRSHPAVADAGATSLPDDRLGAVPVAAVELVDGADVSESDLDAHLRELLAGYKVPVSIRILDRLPRTPSMKVSQPALRAIFEPSTTAGASS